MSEGKTPPPTRSGLDARIDAALREWPGRDRGPLEWDDFAGAIEDRIASGDRGATSAVLSDDDLLGPPLADDAAERQKVVMSEPTSTRKRERGAFKDLAALAGDTKPRAGGRDEDWKEDSGVVDLAALSAEPPAAQAVPAAPAVPEPEAQKPAAAVEPPAPSKPRLVAVAAEGRPARGEERGSRKGLIIAGVVTTLALAAGALFVVKGGGNTPGPAVAQAPSAAAPGPQTPTRAGPAATEQAMDPSQLPVARPEVPAPSANGRLALAPLPSVSVRAVESAAPSATPAPSAVASGEPPKAEPSASPHELSLMEQMRQAANVSPSATGTGGPAQSDPIQPGSVPLKPSQGALSGAVGAVMGRARACLGPDDPVTQVGITFRSDGTVQSVSITGGAAGKPAEACIRQALMSARVQPFAQPTFTHYTNVRPN